MHEGDLSALAEKYGLGAYAHELAGAARTGILLERGGGDSRLGGLPALPTGMEWPEWRGGRCHSSRSLLWTRSHRSTKRESFLARETSFFCQLLGHPDQIQGDMQLEAPARHQRARLRRLDGVRGSARAGARARPAEWRLLLQVDTDEDALGLMWGDVGRVYFWIREADLRAGRLDAVWQILQCH